MLRDRAHFAIEQTILSPQEGIISVAFRIRIALHRIASISGSRYRSHVIRSRSIKRSFSFGERRGIRRGLREPSGVPREDLKSLNFLGILEDRQRSPEISREFANTVKKLERSI